MDPMRCNNNNEFVQYCNSLCELGKKNREELAVDKITHRRGSGRISYRPLVLSSREYSSTPGTAPKSGFKAAFIRKFFEANEDYFKDNTTLVKDTIKHLMKALPNEVVKLTILKDDIDETINAIDSLFKKTTKDSKG